MSALEYQSDLKLCPVRKEKLQMKALISDDAYDKRGRRPETLTMPGSCPSSTSRPIITAFHPSRISSNNSWGLDFTLLYILPLFWAVSVLLECPSISLSTPNHLLILRLTMHTLHMIQPPSMSTPTTPRAISPPRIADLSLILSHNHSRPSHWNKQKHRFHILMYHRSHKILITSRED